MHGVSNLPSVCLIFLLDFGTVLTVWYFYFAICCYRISFILKVIQTSKRDILCKTSKLSTKVMFA